MNKKTLKTEMTHLVPNVFSRDFLDWFAWIDPIDETDLTDRQRQALVDSARAKSTYFTLLARDPDILEARTLTDKDIFYNVKDGLSRAERELAAAATSRFNGCIYCASVHARHAEHYSKKTEDIDKLLKEGVSVELGKRWDALVKASVALSETPSTFSSSHIAALHDAGFNDEEIIDIIHSSSFFNWANRLMLSLGEPEIQKKDA
ncbi:alkylhydroperoxidase domain protein [Bartonella tamiae]|uniref:Avi_7169 family alkylhydroperoxidase domain-containing protein n=1 Tax=Bartonella tamiae Th239 TaxID=1094558 RepID=J1K0P7_9HYPH|nr:alkylhydroperoxidase domain protein [Bartonella tamiae]EJF90610.1 Avi_7169 family alkylhydroperoxidase domain-containing protein [Bartonella tamiae Th239]EJF94012.1 Avi_7169 family alkylhydroperoxidase domain-containing protein [Bartonella tamiae Th307]